MNGYFRGWVWMNVKRLEAGVFVRVVGNVMRIDWGVVGWLQLHTYTQPHMHLYVYVCNRNVSSVRIRHGARHARTAIPRNGGEVIHPPRRGGVAAAV